MEPCHHLNSALFFEIKAWSAFMCVRIVTKNEVKLKSYMIYLIQQICHFFGIYSRNSCFRSINCLGKLVVYQNIVELAAFLSITFVNGLYTNQKGALNREFRSHVIVISVRCYFLRAFNRGASARRTLV